MSGHQDPSGAAGPIARFVAGDHRRLAALLAEATSVPGRVEPAPFEAFRAGPDSAFVERHIEEALALEGGAGVTPGVRAAGAEIVAA